MWMFEMYTKTSPGELLTGFDPAVNLRVESVRGIHVSAGQDTTARNDQRTTALH